MPITTSIWPLFCSSVNNAAPAMLPITPPTTSTTPIWTSTPPRRKCASTPETLAPVTWLAADAAATVGGMP